MKYFKPILFNLLLCLFIQVTIAQNSEALDLLEAARNDSRTSVIEQTFPEEIDIDLPDTISVLGTIQFKGDSGGQMMGVFPSIYTPLEGQTMPANSPTMTAYSVFIESELDLRALDNFFQQSLTDIGYDLLEPRLINRPSRATYEWGFISEELNSFEKSYCNETFQITLFGQKRFIDWEIPPIPELKIYIGYLPSVSTCQEILEVMDFQTKNIRVAQQRELDSLSMTASPTSLPPPRFSISTLSTSINSLILPKLILSPPNNAKVVNSGWGSNMPLQVQNSIEIFDGVKLTSAWETSTTVLSELPNQAIHEHYNQQFIEQGWTLKDSGSDSPFPWSEWSIVDERGVQWTGVLQVITGPYIANGAASIMFHLFE